MNKSPSDRVDQRISRAIGYLIMAILFGALCFFGFWIDAKIFEWKYNRMLHQIPASTAP